jgi:hypothetical protein
MADHRSPRSIDRSPHGLSLASPAAFAPEHARNPQRPQRILFIGPAPLAPMAAICFEALALSSKASVLFACRRGPPRPSAPIAAMIQETGVAAWQSMYHELDAALIEAADLVVTLGSSRRSTDPSLPGVPRRHEHWSMSRGAHEHQPQVRARKLRDGLRARVAMLIFMEGWGRPEMSREAARLTRPPATEGHHPFIPMRPFRVETLSSHPR